ncbi:E3 ubiquitin-protein ligase TRIM37-like [Malaya genurostris]|uniref:E3 ubiquitin-protein ligase TRIM37-like n=1 Tax=Malaya genurostris TaxID=325434 RepID=UPI0026F3CD6B|nr:E3 ubiquitin-protein ligase TRIM37-like [Malaya genurostris]
MQNKTSDSESSLFECCICQDNLQAPQLCPHCSKLFCNKCIIDWLDKENSCPCCRAEINVDSLVKACSVAGIQEAFERLTNRNRCDKHKSLELVLFCNACEECICTSCWFSEHVDHRDQAIPIDKRCEIFEENLKLHLQGLNDRWDKNSEATVQANIALLDQERTRDSELLETMKTESSAHFQKLMEKEQVTLEMLDNDKKEFAKFHEKFKFLSEQGKTAATLNELIEFGKSVELFRLKPVINVETLDFANKNLAVFPEPTVFLFRMERFRETIDKLSFYESIPQGSSGFEWKLKLSYEGNELQCYLRMLKGIPGEYAVSLMEQPEQKLQFEIDTAVLLGICTTDITDDILEVRVLVRQAATYAQKCSQLENYVKQMEIKVVEFRKLFQYLTEWQNESGTLSF